MSTLLGVGLAWNNLVGEGDVVRDTDGSLARGDPLVTSSFVSLFTRRRQIDLTPAELRSVPSGWWADTIYSEPLGSLLWILSRAKLTQQTIRRAALYSQQSLQWWVTNGVAESVSVTSARNGIDRIDIRIEALRSDNNRWAHVWEGVFLGGL